MTVVLGCDDYIMAGGDDQRGGVSLIMEYRCGWGRSSPIDRAASIFSDRLMGRAS